VTRAVWLVLVGIVSVQVGAAFAKDLFGTISPTAIVWLRLVTSALVLAAVARPRLRGRTRRDWLVVVGFGVSLGVMNWAIYQSFARIPLGIAVTIEFIGPLTLAVLGSRRARDLVWVGLAAAGVLLLGFEPADLRWPAWPTPCSPGPRGRRTSCSVRARAPAGRGWTDWRSPASWRPCCSPSRRS
jgi:inner membrane transporter RhtA